MVNSAQKDQIEEVFLAARTQRGAQRIRILDSLCGVNSQIRSAVEELLKADEEADSLLDHPIDFSAAAETLPAESEVTTIGHFKLLQKIGEGGFGVVYLAEQLQPIRRRVALKIIKPGMDSKEVIARFEAERQALAMMDHPNIAKVLDGGTTDSGRPYFAMELVTGVSITDYCDENNLTTKQRLQLFNQVCRAVQHAHQKGVIHRDIKPSNVMVTLHDGQPVPKVIDFGVAKALSQHLTEKTLFTRYGQIVGTPQYMSPEQAEMSDLDVDTRSDIYSLGVLLYELLTGHTPLDVEMLRTAGFDAMRKMICEHEPLKPSTRIRTLDNASATCIAAQRSTLPTPLSKSIVGDIDCIVMKTLEKDRNRRYESANGLLGDIERWLRNEPVDAAAPTFAYQLSKLYRRNRAAVSTLAAIVLASVIAVGLTTWAWLDANQQRIIAQAAVQDSEHNRAEAVANGEEAKRQANAATQETKRAQATLEVLKSLLAQASPDPRLGAEIKVSEFLDSFSKRLDVQELADPDVEIEVRMTLAKSLASFSEYKKAAEQLRVAEDIGRKRYAAGSLELAKHLFSLGGPYADHGRESEAGKERLKEALAIVGNSPMPDVRLQIQILTQLGWLNWPYHERAEQYFARACNLFDGLDATEQAELGVLPHFGLAEMLCQQHKFTEASTAATRSIEVAKRLGNTKLLGGSYLRMSEVTSDRDRFDESNRYAELALAAATETNDTGSLIRIWAQIVENEFFRKRYNVETRRNVALRCKTFIDENWEQIHDKNVGMLLGSVHGALLTAGEAEHAAALEAKATSLPWAGQSDWCDGAEGWFRLDGNLREAIAYNKRGIAIDVEHPSIWHPICVARSYEAVRDFPSQVHWLKEAMKLVDKTTEPWSALAAETSFTLALEYAGQPLKSQKQFAELAVKFENSPSLLWGTPTAACLILAYEKSRELGKEIDETPGSPFDRAVRLLKEGQMPSWPAGVAASHAVLGMVAERHGEQDKAIDWFIQANSKRWGTFAQLYTEWITDHLVELMVEAGRLDELETILRQDIERRDLQVSPIHPERAFVRLRLVQFLVEHNRDVTGAQALLDEAEKVYDYQGDLIPDVERRKLATLRMTLLEERQ